MADSDQQPMSSAPNASVGKSGTPPSTTPPPSLNSSFNFGSSGGSNRNLLGLTPSEEVVFDGNGGGGLVAKLQIKNIATKSLVFKVCLMGYFLIGMVKLMVKLAKWRGKPIYSL